MKNSYAFKGAGTLTFRLGNALRSLTEKSHGRTRKQKPEVNLVIKNVTSIFDSIPCTR